MKAYFFNTMYNLSTQSIQISTLFYTNEIFGNTKRFTLDPIVDEIGGKKGSQKKQYKLPKTYSHLQCLAS